MSRRIVLLGPPGSGKGTQAVFLAERLGVPAISTGEMLRQAVDEGNALGNRVAGIMGRGDLVDDATMAEVVEERLARQDAQVGFLLDGYPRTTVQAETLAGIVERAGRGLDAVLLIDVPPPVLIARALGRGRADDTEEVIAERLRVYGNKTEPLVGYYKALGLLREINGDQTIEAVTMDLVRALER